MAGKKGDHLFCPICEVEVRPPNYDGLTKHILRMHPNLWELLERRRPENPADGVPYVR